MKQSLCFLHNEILEKKLLALLVIAEYDNSLG